MRLQWLAAPIALAQCVLVQAQAPTVDVETLVRRARASPAVRMADADVEAAEAVLEGASPWLPSNPQVSLSVGRRLPAGGLELQAQLQQSLSVAGQRRARRRAARVGIRSAEQERGWLTRRAEHDVRRWAYRAMVERERMGIAEQVRELAEQIRQLALRRVETGEASPMDILLAETELARSRRSELVAALREQQARTELARLVDWPEPQVPVVTGALPELRPPPPLDRAIARALDAPVVVARRTALRSARANVEAADRAGVPNPFVGAYYGREGDTQPAHVWLVTLGVPLPLWRRNQPARASARATVFRRERELERTLRAVRAQVTRLHGAASTAYETARVYETSGLQSVRQSLARTQRAFELGELSLLEVSQMRQRVLAALDEWMEARLAFYDAAEQLAAFLAEGTEE